MFEVLSSARQVESQTSAAGGDIAFYVGARRTDCMSDGTHTQGNVWATRGEYLKNKPQSL
jgi:hypothetical protein